MSSQSDHRSNMTKLLKAADVAFWLDISEPMAYRLMATGEIPTVRINRSVRVRAVDLENYIQEHLTGRRLNGSE